MYGDCCQDIRDIGCFPYESRSMQSIELAKQEETSQHFLQTSNQGTLYINFNDKYITLPYILSSTQLLLPSTAMMLVIMEAVVKLVLAQFSQVQ